MDSFLASASDLDSILDQFERNEDSTSVLQPESMAVSKPTPHQYVASQSSHIMNGDSAYHDKGTSGCSTSYPSTPQQPESNQEEEHKSTAFLIDLSEADFAPAAPQTLPMHKLTNTPNSMSSEHLPPASHLGVVNSVSGVDRVSNSDKDDCNGHRSQNDDTVKSDGHVSTTVPFSYVLPGGTSLSSAVTESQTLVSDQHVTANLEKVNYFNAPTSGLSTTTPVNDGSCSVTGVQSSLLSQPSHDGLGQQSMPVEISEKSIDNLSVKEGDKQTDSEKSITSTNNPKQETMQQKNDQETSQMPLSKAMTPAPLRPELMHEYVKQGARPKIISNIKTQESPVKAVSDTTILPKPGKSVSQTKPAVGFGNATSVKVTDADFEALEQEVGIMSAQDKNKQATQPVFPTVGNQAQLKPSHLNIEELHNPAERVSPISKLLNEQFVKSQHQPHPTHVTQGNELLGLDPFYSQGRGSAKQDTTVTAPKHTNLLESSPMPVSGNTHPNISHTVAPTPETAKHGETKDSALPNDVRSKNAKNLLRNNQPLPGRLLGSKGSVEDLSAQINNSNSQVQMPKVAGGEVTDASLTALQGISLAMSASTGAQMAQPKQQPDVSSLDPVQKYGNNINQQNSVGITGFPSPSRPKNSTDQIHSSGSMPPSSFMPADPPSYQDVKMSVETDRKADNMRQGLSLNFDQSGSRKVAQALPPSPIIENVAGREDAFRMPEQNTAPEHQNLVDLKQPTFHAESQVNHLQGEVSSAPFVPAPNAVTLTQNNLFPDNDSMTPSNETDSEEGEFSHRVMDYSEGVMQLGAVAPVWVPDSEALNCMNCQQKFTFRKRRHHCRACGKVFCAKCCSMRLKLKYMESKEARVCISCLNVILRAQALKRTQGENQQEPQQQQQPDQESQGSGHEAAGSAANNRSSLRRPSTDGSRPRETRKVRFSDGLNPGVDTGRQAILDSQSGTVPLGMEADFGPNSGFENSHQGVMQRSLIPMNEDGLPPVIIATEVKGEYNVQVNPVSDELIQEMRNSNALPVVFALNRNLLVRTKIINLNCCVNRTCWCFATQGMANVGQDEIVIVLECLPDEKVIPKDIFFHLQSLYEQAFTGMTVSHMGHSIFSQSFLGGREHGGFLYLRPSFQCLGKLLLPEPPYLFAVLLQKWETPWAKVFPLRLLLRLGAEFRYYPCPLMSVRFRKPVFGEIGHTIMNLLADFKNYQYKLPVIPGIVIHMQDRETLIKIPRNRYDDVMKVVNNSNEHVMAIAANFSADADSHLVCIQNDEGTYHTQAISIQNKARKVTGASFVVFNGALKTSSGLTAKSSIVEDGLMIQILPETMAALRQALREMLDLPIPCGSTQAEQPDETVTLTWVDDDKAVNVGVVSPIDQRSLEGIESIRIHNGTDFRGRSRSLRWTEVFFLENNESPVDLSRLAEMLSTAFCVALTGQLDELREAGMIKLALRVTVDSDKVGYEAGSKGELLPPVYMNELDNELIPVLHNAVSQHEGGPVIMELVFYIIE